MLVTRMQEQANINFYLEIYECKKKGIYLSTSLQICCYLICFLRESEVTCYLAFLNKTCNQKRKKCREHYLHLFQSFPKNSINDLTA